MKKLLIVLLLTTAPALAEDTRIQGDPHALGMQLSKVDTAYRQGCINRRDRDEVWGAAEVMAEITHMDWAKVQRIGKSYRYNSIKCSTARGIVGHARGFNAPWPAGTD